MFSMISNKSTFRFISFLALLGSLGFSSVLLSCGGSCAGFDCVNGDCVQGACECDEGWEGTTCNTTWGDKFVGSYEGTDCYDTGLARYTINKTNRPDSIIFDNQFYALVKDGDQLLFPEQDAEEDGAEFVFSGTGSITSAGVNLVLFSKYPNFDIKCELKLDRVN